MHEYPLSMVDHLYFKQFICSLASVRISV
ncbi:hypothetical protein LINGRAHAP2_LOCUS27252 [Linum grandiflorum]